MKNLCLFVSSLAAVLAAMGQSAAPVVTSLGAYARPLQAPARVATDDAGNVYVTDPSAGQVVVFDAFGRQVASHTGFGGPLGIAVDPRGVIYLAEEQTGSVSAFDTSWNLLYRLGSGNGEFQLPNHIALDLTSANRTVYVSDSGANLIKAYVGSALIAQFGGAGAANGQFDFPAGLCVSPSGEVFVVDQNNDRVQVFDRAGQFLRAFNLGSSRPSGRSQAALLDRSGRLHVVDTYQAVVKQFNAANGTLLASLGSYGQMPGQLDSPAGLALDAGNRLFVASANSGRIELYGLDSYVHLSSRPAFGLLPAGTDFALAAMAGGTGPWTFQWFRNGVAIVDATNSTFSLPNIGFGQGGAYSVVVVGPSASFTSSLAQVTVQFPPRIFSDPQSLTVLRGANVVLAVVAGGTSLSYQWQLNGLNVEGATNRTLALPDLQLFQAGSYTVVVSNSVGAVASAPARVSVLVAPSVMQILSCSMAANQVFQLSLNTDPGFSYSIDASTNLSQWESLTNFLQDGTLNDFTDTSVSNLWSRYYRLRWMP